MCRSFVSLKNAASGRAFSSRSGDHPLRDLSAPLLSVDSDGRAHVQGRVRQAIGRGHRRSAFELLDPLSFQSFGFPPIGRAKRLTISVAVNDDVEPGYRLPRFQRLIPAPVTLGR